MELRFSSSLPLSGQSQGSGWFEWNQEYNFKTEEINNTMHCE